VPTGAPDLHRTRSTTPPHGPTGRLRRDPHPACHQIETYISAHLHEVEGWVACQVNLRFGFPSTGGD
jgi:hypothetical protein